MSTDGDVEPSAFDQAPSRPPARPTPPAEQQPGDRDSEAKQLIAVYEQEAKARGNDPSAAPLFFQIGRIWEHRLKSLRNAAACYQSAYRLDPAYRPNLTAARRLFSKVGNWQIVEQLIEADIRATRRPDLGTAASREPELRALMLEKAQLLSERLGRASEAWEILLELGESDSPGPSSRPSPWKVYCNRKGMPPPCPSSSISRPTARRGSRTRRCASTSSPRQR